MERVLGRISPNLSVGERQEMLGVINEYRRAFSPDPPLDIASRACSQLWHGQRNPRPFHHPNATAPRLAGKCLILTQIAFFIQGQVFLLSEEITHE